MKFKTINLLFALYIVSLASACQANKPSTILENIVNDYKQQMSIGWGPYKMTEFFSKAKEKFSYLEKTFGKSVLSDAINIQSRNINMSEVTDTEGGYELGMLLISYKNSDISNEHYKTIISSPNKNLRGTKVFIGYTALQCGSDVIIISSPAVVTKKIKNYFLHFKNSKELCR